MVITCRESDIKCCCYSSRISWWRSRSVATIGGYHNNIIIHNYCPPYFAEKKVYYSLSVNKSSDENITTVTENNTVHKPAVHIATVNAGFEITHESTEQQSLTENCRDSKLHGYGAECGI